METFIQPKITGCRQLDAESVALMNEGKALAEACGIYVEKLRLHPPTKSGNIPSSGTSSDLPSLDQRWINIGATQIQQGFMAVIRGIAQPSTF